MNRYERYQVLKTAVLRADWACLADDPSERTVERADGLYVAWERIGRLAYPMDGDYPRSIKLVCRYPGASATVRL